MRGPAGDTPKGRAARARIVEAAWDLLVHDGSVPLTATRKSPPAVENIVDEKKPPPRPVTSATG